MSAVARSEQRIGGVVPADLEATITPRQLELLALYASGYSYTEIGTIRFISPYTVRNILLRALSHTQARNLTHLCVIVCQAGMIRRNTEGIYEPVSPDLRIAE